jgi:hypothetical protein
LRIGAPALQFVLNGLQLLGLLACLFLAGLQLLEGALLGVLQGAPLGDVAQHAHVAALAVQHRFVYRELNGEGRAVFAAGFQLAVFAHHARLARLVIAGHIAVVGLAVGAGHQQANVLAQHFVFVVAKCTLRGGVEGLDDAARADYHNGVYASGQHGAHGLLGGLLAAGQLFLGGLQLL